MSKMMLPLPLLSGGDHCCYPQDAVCPVCGKRFSETHGHAYLSGGAMPLAGLSDLVTSADMEAFFHVGFHGDDVEVRHSVDAEIVKDLKGEQFDILMCSLSCMRKWLNTLLDKLEQDLADQGCKS